MNQLIKVTKNGTIVAEYTYDPEGFRVVKRAKGETTHYIFQGTEPIFEKKISTGKIKSYVYALGKHLARVDGVIGDDKAKKYWYVTDHLGSIRAVTDKDGKKVWSADYLAFGKQYIKDGDFEELHSFTGKEYDPDTGLHYYNARWYDGDLGRFISEDPVGDPNNPNLYSYGANNPMRLIDPTGLYGYDTQTGQISHSDGTITDTKGNVISTPPSAGGSGSSDSGSTDSGSLSPSTPTPDPSGDSGSGEETKKTPTGEQESIGANTDKKPEGDTKNIADDIEKEKSQQIAVVIKEEVKITEIPIGRYLKAEVKVSLDVTQKPEGDYYTITVGPNGKMRITDEDGKSVNIVRETIASIGIKVAEITQVELSNGSKITCSLSFQADGKGAIQVFSSSYHSPNNGPVTTVSLKTSDQLEQDLNAAAFVAAQVWSSVQQVATDPNTYKAAAAVAGLILAF